MGFSNIINKLKSLAKGSTTRFDVVKATADIINENEIYIRSLLLSQMKRGVDADEKPFGIKRRNGIFYEYAERTVFEKEELGLQTDIIQYKHTGKFHGSLFATASGRRFVFESPVPYFNDILDDAEAGERIIELSKANLLKMRNELILPQLEVKYKMYRNGL